MSKRVNFLKQLLLQFLRKTLVLFVLQEDNSRHTYLYNYLHLINNY